MRDLNPVDIAGRAAVLRQPLFQLAHLALACGLAFPAQAREAKPSNAGRPPTLVTLDVVVTGPGGEPVADLQASDLHVFEDKRSQKILFFRPRERVAPQQALLGPNEFSNHSRPRLPPPTVVLLDLLNEWHSTGAIGSFEIGKALQRLEPNERLSLYLLTRRAEIYPVYTLQRAEADVADSRPPWTRTAPTLLDAAMRSVPGTRSGALADAGLRFDPTIQLLRTLAAWMMAVPGYKNLIWITHGVPLSVHDLGAPLDLSAYVRQLAAAMVRSHINVYSVDQSAQGAGGGFDVSADMLREISNWTGGRELASDRADDAIEEAIHDARGSYVLAYERTAQKHPPEYLKLRVICDRKGTHVLSRAGEVDAASAPLSDQEELDLIDASARAPLDSSDIGVNARLSASGASPSRAHLDIQVDARDLFLRQGVDGRFQGRLYRVLAGFDEDGLKELPPPEEWNVNLTAEEYQKGLRDGIDLATDVYPHLGIQKIRCLVMDRELNVTGSVTIPIPGRGDPSGH